MKSLIVIHESKYLVLNIMVCISDVSEMNESRIRHSGLKH